MNTRDYARPIREARRAGRAPLMFALGTGLLVTWAGAPLSAAEAPAAQETSVAQPAPPAQETPRIDPDALLERMADDDDSLIVLDVRTPQEFAAGHVPGAMNIPHTQLPARVSELGDSSGKDIVVYCATGRRAEIAAATLREHGIERLLHLDGDMREWQASQRPLER